MSAAGWRRVSAREQCPVCGKPDWCLVARNGGAAICARTESARRAGAAGYLHRLPPGVAPPPPRPTYTPPKPPPPPVDLARTMEQARGAVSGTSLVRFAAELGVSKAALWALGIGQRSDEWLFPMRDADGDLVGIRRRLTDGRKLSVAGGREGLFIPTDVRAFDPLLICEGPTDCAAALSLGFDAIGRPSCMGGAKLAALFCIRRDVKRVVIVADGDEPGQRGARDLATELRRYVGDVRIIAPPESHKDLRSWLCGGATRADVQRLIDLAEAEV